MAAWAHRLTPEQRAVTASIATKNSMPEALVLLILASAHFDVALAPDTLNEIGRHSLLLPPHELTTVTGQLTAPSCPVSRTRSKWEPDRLTTLEALAAAAAPKFDDELLCTIWPARTKTDLQLRRTRLRDTMKCWTAAGRAPQMWRVLRRLPGFDQITVQNILLASWMLSTDTFDWFDYFDGLGAFDEGIEHYTEVVKWESNRAKKSSDPVMSTIECGMLTGYRNMPYPGFDPFSESERLAHGGTSDMPQTLLAIAPWRRAVEARLRGSGPAPTFMTFEEFVQSGDWETAGASSIGRVDWSLGGEEGHFKARKNVVPDVVDLATLAQDALKATVQLNYVMIKAEAGKLRVAVAGDLHTYLKMAYLARFCEGAAGSWQSSTLGEEGREQCRRMAEMLDVVRSSWNLPFDLKEFDHLPSTDEIATEAAVYYGNGIEHVPPWYEERWRDIVANVLTGLYHGVMIARFFGLEQQFPITGGLPSGTRITSRVGSGWNLAKNQQCMTVASYLGVALNPVLWVQGDDTSISFPCYVKTFAYRLLLQAVGADGNDQKFSIAQGESEYLRLRYDAHGVRGYPARALIGLTQRKPWSAAPWSANATIVALYDVCATLRRRGCDRRRVDAWWRAERTCWSQLNRASTTWLGIPAALGGPAAEPWDGRWVPTERWTQPSLDDIEIAHVTPWRAAKLTERYAELYPLSEHTARALAHRQLVSKLSSDDVPAIARSLRARVVRPSSTFRRLPEPRWTMPAVAALSARAAVLQSLPADARAFDLDVSVPTGEFGHYAHLASDFDAVSAAFEVERRRDLIRWCEGRWPAFAVGVRRLERRGLARFEAIDWLLGRTAPGRSSVHPALAPILTTAVMSCMAGHLLRKLAPYEFQQLLSITTTLLAQALSGSQLSTQLYAW